MHDIRTANDQDLNEFADLVADQIRDEIIPLTMALDALQAAALELNRRHGNASLQDDFAGAVLTMQDYAEYCASSDRIAPMATLCALRATGAALDLGTDEQWVDLESAGYTQAVSLEFLHSNAIAEGLRRGFDHRPRVAVLVPAGADRMAPPF